MAVVVLAVAVAAVRVKRVMSETNNTPIIELENIKKVYQTGEVEVHAIRNVSLRVERGEFVAIMGASGSGKSTMMNTIGCLDRPTEGRYRLDGIDVSGLKRDQLAEIRNKKIGFVFQGFNLLARTSALENVELPMFYCRPAISAKDQRDRAMAALELVGLGDRAHHHPSQLSGGQQQRVAIARALAIRPALVLADEPTGNLDSRTSIEVMGVFQELNTKGITIVMVTHELDIASYTKRVVVMRDGRIVKDSPVERRLAAGEELRRLEEEERAIQLTS